MSKEAERSSRKALGKGLSALLSSRSLAAENDAGPASTEKVAWPTPFEEFQNIPVEQIRPGTGQPRGSFDTDKLMELSQSIRANGIIQPITVYREGPDRYRIIAGERRWQAAILAGLKEIPTLVRNADAHQRLELALIENLQREDLNPIEIASAFERLNSEYGLSHEQIAERTGKDRSTVTNLLRLLRLSPPVREALVSGKITVGHARALLNLTDETAQQRACEEVVQNQLSVRDTELLVKRQAAKPLDAVQQRKIKADGQAMDPNVRAAIEEMAAALGTRVRLVSKSPNSGRIEIEYYSQDDLDRIYAVIVKQ